MSPWFENSTCMAQSFRCRTEIRPSSSIRGSVSFWWKRLRESRKKNTVRLRSPWFRESEHAIITESSDTNSMDPIWARICEFSRCFCYFFCWEMYNSIKFLFQWPFYRQLPKINSINVIQWRGIEDFIFQMAHWLLTEYFMWRNHHWMSSDQKLPPNDLRFSWRKHLLYYKFSLRFCLLITKLQKSFINCQFWQLKQLEVKPFVPSPRRVDGHSFKMNELDADEVSSTFLSCLHQ